MKEDEFNAIFLDLNQENDFFVTTLEEEGFSLSKEEDADSIKQMI
ncbi:hypothetical protein [Metabacillus idriensis]|nr:hypothetical protein [Metabacillus idriensis]